MSQYTTGELAKLCQVSVRTVQFYDTKGLLHPAALSEGGRRLYTEADLSKLRLICVLKSLGLSLDAIKGILESPAPHKVLLLFLEEQAKQLDRQLLEQQSRREAIETVCKSIRSGEIVSVNSICDIERIMNGKAQLKKTHLTLLVVGILLDLAQLAAILIWIFRGNWYPFAILMPFVILVCALLVRLYYRRAAYLCPECNAKFKPAMKQFFFAKHTAKTRKLTCTACGHQGWCVETYGEEEPPQQ